jgi:glutamate--cysteine ligase
MDPQKTEAIRSVDDLVAHFVAGNKGAHAQLRVGVEHEKIGVLADGSAPDHARIARVLEALAKTGWRRVVEHEQLIALEHATQGNVTLEPGGQIEHSGAPLGSAARATRDNDEHVRTIVPLARAEGITLLGCGFRPFGTIDDVPWMPKGRYRVMREYLPTRGARAHDMMKRTTTVQANFDYVDEADAMEKLRVSMGLSSLVTALFAASPIVDGRVTEYQSFRAACWLATDPDRCGLLPFAFDPNATFRNYTEWALDVPLFFIYRGGEYRAAHGLTFRRFLREGFEGERARLGDWELHLSTLFPEVRLKRYLEMRQADAGPMEMVRALPALWQGVLYDREARSAAWKLVADWSFEERLALYQRTPLEGIRGSIRGRPLIDLCRELVKIACAGVGCEDPRALEPLERIIAEKRTVADRIADAHRESGGDPTRLIPALALS